MDDDRPWFVANVVMSVVVAAALALLLVWSWRTPPPPPAQVSPSVLAEEAPAAAETPPSETPASQAPEEGAMTSVGASPSTAVAGASATPRGTPTSSPGAAPRGTPTPHASAAPRVAVTSEPTPRATSPSSGPRASPTPSPRVSLTSAPTVAAVASVAAPPTSEPKPTPRASAPPPSSSRRPAPSPSSRAAMATDASVEPTYASRPMGGPVEGAGTRAVLLGVSRVEQRDGTCTVWAFACNLTNRAQEVKVGGVEMVGADGVPLTAVGASNRVVSLGTSDMLYLWPSYRLSGAAASGSAQLELRMRVEGYGVVRVPLRERMTNLGDFESLPTVVREQLTAQFHRNPTFKWSDP